MIGNALASAAAGVSFPNGKSVAKTVLLEILIGL
jgi:hypothetical protein